MILLLMGVCGSGKTTVGELLAQKLGWPFADADTFHSGENKLKMTKGVALDDEDRWPWLDAIYDYMKRLESNSQSGVVTCSALKHCFRHRLLYGPPKRSKTPPTTPQPVDVMFVHLEGDQETIQERMKLRKGHFMSPELLESQLKTLEPPRRGEPHMTISTKGSLDEIVQTIMERLSCDE